MRILNLYAGIGGNRRLWGDSHNITAVELDSKRAGLYHKSYPNDTIITQDAHQYLLDNYKDFDFIWSSPPCQTHSRVNFFLNPQGIIRYPDMSLYQEIIFLQTFYKGKFCIENVIGYYKPLTPPQIIGRHYIWANFKIPKIPQPNKQIGRMCGKNQCRKEETTEMRNMVDAQLGLHILNCAQNIYNQINTPQIGIFSDNPKPN